MKICEHNFYATFFVITLIYTSYNYEIYIKSTDFMGPCVCMALCVETSARGWGRKRGKGIKKREIVNKK